MPRRWLPLILCCTAALALPFHAVEETDSEESRKVLGSSVVTSVSVIMDLGNGTKQYYADAAGRPVPKPTAASLVGSPAQLMNPDRYEFYTFDEAGDLVKRLMTLDEIQSIIANGETDIGEPGRPNYYHQSLPSGPAPVAAAVATDMGELSSSVPGVQDVVMTVQNLLKEQMEKNKPLLVEQAGSETKISTAASAAPSTTTTASKSSTTTTAPAKSSTTTTTPAKSSTTTTAPAKSTTTTTVPTKSTTTTTAPAKSTTTTTAPTKSTTTTTAPSKSTTTTTAPSKLTTTTTAPSKSTTTTTAPTTTTTTQPAITTTKSASTTIKTTTTTTKATPTTTSSTTPPSSTSTTTTKVTSTPPYSSKPHRDPISAASSSEVTAISSEQTESSAIPSSTTVSTSSITQPSKTESTMTDNGALKTNKPMDITSSPLSSTTTTKRTTTKAPTPTTTKRTATTTTTTSSPAITTAGTKLSTWTSVESEPAASSAVSSVNKMPAKSPVPSTTTTTKPTSTRPVINRDPLEPTMVMISSSESIESEDIAAAQEFLNIFSQPNLQKITASYTRRPTTEDNKIMVSSSSSATPIKPIRRPLPSTMPTTSPSRKPVRTTTPHPATTTTTTESSSSASSIEENSMSTMELLKTTSSSTTTTEKAEAENSIINEATVFVPTKIHSPLESMPHTGAGNIAMPPELAESFLGVLSQVADIGGADTTIDYGDNGMMLISSSTTTKRSTTEGIKKTTTSRTPTTEQPTTPPVKTEPSTSTMSTTMKTEQPSVAIMRDEEPSNIAMKTEKPKLDQSTVTTMRTEQSASTTMKAQQPLTTTTEAEQSSISTMKEEKQATTTVASTATREEQPSNIVLKTEKPTTITTTKPEEAAATTARTEQPMSTTIKTVQPPYAFVKRKQTTTKPERTTEMKTEEPTTTTINIEEILEEKPELHSTTTIGISETTLRAEANRQDEVTTEFATETTTTETNIAMETSSLTPKPTEKDRSTMAPSILVEKTKDSDKVGSETKVIEGVGNKVNAPVKADDNKGKKPTGQEEDSNKKDGIKNKVNLKTSDKEQSDDDLAMSLLVEMSKIYASKNSTTTPESEVSTTERLEDRTTTLATDTEATTVNAVQESTTTIQNANTRRNDINAEVDVDKTTAAAESTTKAAEEATESQTSKGPEIPIAFQTKYKKEDQTEDVANVNDLKRLTTEKAETTTLTQETTTAEEVTTNKERERDESMTDLRTVLPPSTTEAVLTTEEVRLSSEDTTSVKPTETTTESETEQPTSTTQSPETTSLPQMNKQIDRETALSQTDSVEDITMTEIVKTTSTTATVPSTTENEKIAPKITKKPSSTTKKTTTTTTEAPTTSAEILKVNVNAEEKFKDTKVKAQPEGPEKQKPLALEPVPKENLGLEASSTGLGEDVRSFSELCNELAFRLWASLTSRGMTTSRSLILSPFAVTSLLAMVFLGARGPTSGQMNDILRLDDMVTFNPHLVFRNVTESVGLSKGQGIATAAFVRELYSDKMRGKLLDFYKDRVQQFYDGHVEEVNFNMIGDLVRRRTNLLIKRQTRGRVPEYLRGNNVMLRPPLAVFSANIFQTDCTRASTYGRDGEMFFTVMPASRSRRLVPVPAVVWFSGFLAGYEPVLDATAASIGAADSLVSLVLVLPGQQAQVAPGDGLPRLEQRLIDTSYRRGAWSRLLRSLAPRQGLELQIPRFSHRSLLNVTAPLQRMGLRDLFSAEHADLRGINGIKNDLHLSDIVQVNTFSTCAEESVGSRHHVEVYPTSAQRSGREDLEEDPRKAPSSMDDLEDFGMSSVPLALRPRQARLPDAPRLKFDRPFLYFVRHNPTGLILHMGRFNPRILH